MAVVEVSVGDTNDNAPLFLSNPLILGVPTYITHNDLVAVVKVTLIQFWKWIKSLILMISLLIQKFHLILKWKYSSLHVQESWLFKILNSPTECFGQGVDADIGNHRVLVYNLIGGADRDAFYLNSMTGELFSKIDMGLSVKKVLEIELLATDNWGEGNSAATMAKVTYFQWEWI